MHWGHEIPVGRENGKTITRKATRAEVNESLGVEVPEAPEVPKGAESVWRLWWRLNARRQIGEAVGPLTYQEIGAFASLSGTAILPEELVMLEAIDDAYIRAMAEEQRAKMDREREAREREKSSAQSAAARKPGFRRR